MNLAAGNHIEPPGNLPELVLSWNRMEAAPAAIDVVLHLHGYSQSGEALNLVTEKLPVSGVDFSAAGPSRPTLGIIPRGHFFGGRTGHGYDFQALFEPGAVAALVGRALARYAEVAAIPVPSIARRILTAHSGGGAALMPVAGQFDPDEIHVFDALYGPSLALEQWAAQAIARDTPQHGLRVLYIAGSGTEAASLAVATAIDRAFATSGKPASSRYRVEAVTVDHGVVAQRYGVELLAGLG